MTRVFSTTCSQFAWDARACAACAILFIGVARPSSAGKLRAGEVLEVKPDLSDAERFFSVVQGIKA
jgi:hypothetical protein